MAFNFTVNGAQSGAANLLALINYSNATTITDAQVAFAPPIELTGGYIDAYGRNTTVVVTSVQNQGFIDDDSFNDGVTVKYRRTSVAEGVSSVVSDFSITAATTWDQLKTSVAAANNMVLGDIIISLQGASAGSALIYDTHPPVGGGEGNFINADVAAAGDSYVYHQNDTLSIKLNYEATDTPLHTVITTTDLYGFTAVV
jgi:hypothetical protein